MNNTKPVNQSERQLCLKNIKMHVKLRDSLTGNQRKIAQQALDSLLSAADRLGYASYQHDGYEA